MKCWAGFAGSSASRRATAIHLRYGIRAQPHSKQIQYKSLHIKHLSRYLVQNQRAFQRIG
jgi:hypothetical protein